MGFRKGSEGPSFFDLFSQQAANLVSGAALLASILDASAQARVALRDHLHEIEHQGDEINHRIAQLVNQTFVTPFDREDLGAVASCLDDCMDFIDEAGDLIVMYGTESDLAAMQANSLLSQVRAIKNGAVAFVGNSDPMAASTNPGPLSIPWGIANYVKRIAAAADKAK